MSINSKEFEGNMENLVKYTANQKKRIQGVAYLCTKQIFDSRHFMYRVVQKDRDSQIWLYSQ